jgi:hypothetical protein
MVRQKVKRASELEAMDHRLAAKSRDLLARSRARLARLDPQ